jgi:hypothetical protein
MPETDSSTVQVVQAYYDILTGGIRVPLKPWRLPQRRFV